jgi:hypothetical protein
MLSASNRKRLGKSKEGCYEKLDVRKSVDLDWEVKQHRVPGYLDNGSHAKRPAMQAHLP